MLTIDNERCLQCGTCIGECPTRALSMVDKKVVWNESRCMVCGHCLAVCPRDCIVIDGDGYDCEEVEELTYAQTPNKYQFRNMVLKRRSVRKYTDTPVSEEELNYILEAGKYSPTGKNKQGNAFLVVMDEKVKELAEDTFAACEKKLEKGTIPEEVRGLYKSLCRNFREKGKDGLYFKAPMVIVVFGDTDVDAAIAATTMGFAANAVQLGFCYARMPLTAFDDPEFAAKWQLPEGKKPAICLLIGNTDPEYFCSVPRKDPQVVLFTK